MQVLNNDCGLAVLKTVFEQLGLFKQADSLKVDLSEEGISLYEMTKILSSFGVESDSFEVSDLEELKKVKFPCIAMINSNGLAHYVVLQKYLSRSDTFIVSNPIKPDIEKVTYNDLKSEFIGYSIIIEDVKPKEKQSISPKNKVLEVYKYVISNISISSKIELSIILFTQFALPLIFYQLLQDLLSTEFQNLNSYNLSLIVIFYSSFFLTTYFTGIRYSQLKLKIENNLQSKIINDFYHMNMNDFQKKNNVNNLVGYLSTVIDSTSGLLEKFFLSFDLFFSIFLLLLMFQLNYFFPLIFIFLTVIYVIYLKSTLKNLMNYNKNLSSSYNELLSTFESNVLGSNDVFVHDKSEDAENKLKSTEIQFFKAKYLSELLKNKIGTISSIISFMMIVMILVVTYLALVYRNEILYPLSSGLYVFFIVISLLERMSDSYLSYKTSLINIDYVQSIKNFIQEDTKKEEIQLLNVKKDQKLIFSNISYIYDGMEDFVFENFSLSLSPGEINVLKGENGVGKTTFAKIILGLLTPKNGDIYIGKTKLKSLDKTNIISEVSYYTPNQYLFYGTSSSNAKMKIFDNQYMDSYKSIFQDKVSDNIILYNNGINVSQGQRQKLLLDRCFSKQASIYILDEPTGNLDQTAKQDLINKIVDLKIQNKLILVITHDEDIISIADKVLKMRKKNDDVE
ncbi:ATP-binding cassette domain-containing protein [Xylocopilactobacillus apis]|nr:ATP-binding cassette domain-containing protein [Xylocopilactobacillus apis]